MKMTYYKEIIAAGLLLSVAACSIEPPVGPGTDSADGRFPSGKIINTSRNSVKGSLLVKLSDISQGDILRDELKSSAIGVEPLFGMPANTKAGTPASDLDRWFLLKFSGERDLDSLASALSVYDGIVRIEFDKQIRKASDGRSYPIATLMSKAAGSLSFNDPEIGRQWHYSNDGSEDIAPTAKRGADINVADAWRLETGRKDVIVAIIDEGVQYDHPDLKQNMWTNLAELNGQPGVDDDGNGYVDDIYGYNFVNDTPEIKWGDTGNSGHGTHVAGTVAAVNNNGIGVAGVAGGDGSADSGVRMMTLQIFNGDVSSSSATAKAIRYAADMGACIIQCSWGSEAGAYGSDNAFASASSAQADALDYFINGKNNVPAAGNCAAIPDGNIAIFAAGNDAADMASYPGASRDCISVTSIASDNLPACYTNYGPGCNIAAPGGEYYTGGMTDSETGCVLSTMPTESILSYAEDGSEVHSVTDYGYMQGTSMACPHVSGVAALGISYALDLGKTFTRDEFVSILLTSVNDLDSYLVGTKTTLVDRSIGEMPLAPFSGKMGTGTIDAWKVLMQIEGTPCLLAEAGKSQRLSLDSVFGSGSRNLTYLGVEISEEDSDAIGLMLEPQIKGGMLLIQPTQYGSAKMTVRAIAGGSQVGGGTNMGGMEISREVSVIVRDISNGNGGWL